MSKKQEFIKYVNELITAAPAVQPNEDAKLYWDAFCGLDENGEKLVFNSMVDAMNFMGELGWEFQDAYVITVGQQHVYHWLLAKYISDESINEGLTTKQEYKEKQFVN